MVATIHHDEYSRLDDLAHQLRLIQPLVGQFLVTAVGMARSGEMSRRQACHAALSVAYRLEDINRAFSDQLRGAVQVILAVRVIEAPIMVRER